MNVRRHYAAWNFYMSLYDEPECDEGFSPIRAREFIDNYHDHYGNDTLVTDPMESAYVGVRSLFFSIGIWQWTAVPAAVQDRVALPT